MKILGAGAVALIVAGLTTTVVVSGEVATGGEIVVASLLVLPAAEAEAAYPLPMLGLARSLEVRTDEIAPPVVEEAPAVAIEPQPDSRAEQIATLSDSESFAQYRELNALNFIPVPTPRPDVSAGPVVERAAVRPRPQVRRARAAGPVVRVATSDAPRKRVLRANGPIFVGVYR